MNIKEFLDQDEKKDLLRLLTAGSVDDGKSTLIGRLLFDSKKLYEDQISALKKDSLKIGHAGEEIDYALLLDGLKAEREQGITIDVAYRYFSTNKRKFIIADTPGHEQYTRNMVTGASTANLAIILVDASQGVITQTRRHTFLVSMLGIKHVVLAVNKMDLMNYEEDVFERICDDYKAFITGLNIPDVTFIPLSALKGDNVVDVSDNMPWYHGKSMLEFLETVHVSSDRNYEDFRFPIQYVLRPSHNFRGFSGKVSSGTIKKGDEIVALPSRKTSKIKGIHIYEGEIDEAFTPQGITLTLEDEIDISRGEMIVSKDNFPHIERHFEAMLVWMDEKRMNVKTTYFIKHNTNKTKALINEIKYKINVNTLEKFSSSDFELNEIGRVVITTNKPLLFDPYQKNKNTGSFVLIDPVTNNTSAVGMIIDKLSSDDLVASINPEIDLKKINKGQSLISTKEREGSLNQKGHTIWITGLHGSGKNEIAYQLEKNLFNSGAITILLDGSTLRSGLSRELEFSFKDRIAHLERVAHIARILNDQGIIVICSFISPDKSIRDRVKTIIGDNRFHLIYQKTELSICKNNKPDLYNKYDNGLIGDLPGYNSEYQEPDDFAIIFNDLEQSINDKINTIAEYLSDNKIYPIS